MKYFLFLVCTVTLSFLLASCDNHVFSQSQSTGISTHNFSTNSATDKVSVSQSTNNNSANNKEQSTMSKGNTRIRLSFNGHQAVAILTDNPTTRSLLKQLPITIAFEDFANTEKIAYFPNKLSTEKAPDGYTPAVGDLTCYGPWGNLAIFYKSRSYAKGLIYLGTLESGLTELSQQGSDFTVTIEIIE